MQNKLFVFFLHEDCLYQWTEFVMTKLNFVCHVKDMNYRIKNDSSFMILVDKKGDYNE